MRICAGRFSVTHFMDADWMREHGVVDVYDVFVFDPERAVHCCSITPSTECFHVRHGLEFSPDATDAQREAADEEASTWEADRVFYVDRVPTIVHERQVDEGTEYEDAIEEAIEWHNCNHVL